METSFFLDSLPRIFFRKSHKIQVISFQNSNPPIKSTQLSLGPGICKESTPADFLESDQIGFSGLFGNMYKISSLVPSKNLSPEKTETNYEFTFQSLSDKID